MLKKILTGTGIVAVLAVVFFLGSLAVGTVFATDNNTTPQAIMQNADDDDAAEAALEGPDIDAIEDQFGDQSELDDGAAEASEEGSDLDEIDNQVEQDGEFEGEY